MFENFNNTRAKYLDTFGPAANPSNTFYYSTVLGLYSQELKEKYNVTENSQLIPYIEEILARDFELPQNSESFLSLAHGSEQSYYLTDGSFNRGQFATRQKVVHTLMKDLQEAEEAKGKNEENLLHSFFAQNGKIDSKFPNYTRTIEAVAKNEMRNSKVELAQQLQSKGALRRKHTEEELRKSPSKSRYEKALHSSLHSLSALPDEQQLSGQYEDVVESLITSVLSLEELYFTLKNCQKHNYSLSVTMFDGEALYSGIVGIGESRSSRIKRKEKVLNFFRACVKQEDMTSAMYDSGLEGLFEKNRINVNETKDSVEEYLRASESFPKQELRERVRVLYKRELPYKKDVRARSAQLESEQREVARTQVVWYNINNLDLFYRHVYPKGYHRQSVFCPRCHQMFWSATSEKYLKHTSLCRGDGLVGLELLPKDLPKFDTHLFWHNPKALENPAIVIAADMESLLLSPREWCNNCHRRFKSPRLKCSCIPFDVEKGQTNPSHIDAIHQVVSFSLVAVTPAKEVRFFFDIIDFSLV